MTRRSRNTPAPALDAVARPGLAARRGFMLATSGWRGRRFSAVMALAGLLGVLLSLVTVAPASAAGRPNVAVTITNAAGASIDVVPSTANFEYQVRASYTCMGDTDCTNMTVSIGAPDLDPYYGTEMKEYKGSWTPPFSPAPAATGDWDKGWTINLGTVKSGDIGTIVFSYFIKAPPSSGGDQVTHNLCCSNFFPPDYPIDPEVTVTADGAAPVTGTDHATYQSIVPTPGLTVSAQAKVKTDTELPLTVNAVSNCWRRNNYGTFKALYDRLCSDSATITVKLPAKATYVAGSGGSYDAGAHAVTLTAGPAAWRGLEGGAFKVTFSSLDYPTSGAGCAVSASFAASGTVTYLNGAVKMPANYTRAVTVDNCQPFAKGTFSKTASRSSYQIPTTTPLTGHYWLVDTLHQGNVPAIATVTDTTLDQPGLPVHNITTNSLATITVTLDDASTDSVTGKTEYNAPAGRRIVSATVVSDRLAPVNSDPAGTAGTRFRVFFNFTVQPDATPADLTNTASATLTYPDNPELGTFTPTGSPDDYTVELFDVAPFAKASVEKLANAASSSYAIPVTTTTGSYWYVDTCNQANVQGFATVVDDALDQPGMPVYQINTNSAATITYTLDNGTTVTVTGKTTTLAVPTNRRIVKATVQSEALAPGNTVSTGTGCTRFRVYYYFRVEAGATPGDRTNTASATMTYPNTGLGTITPAGSPATKTVNLYSPATPYTINASAMTWENITNGTFPPRAGDEVVWKANGQFCNLATAKTITPQYVFFAPTDWNIRVDGASLAGSPGATFDYETITYNGVAYDAVVVTWSTPVAGVGTTTGSNCVNLAQLTVKTTPTLAAVVGPQTGRFFVGDAAEAPAETYSGNVSEATTASDIDADGNTSDTFASSSSAATLTGVPGLLPLKEICQPDATQPDGCTWLSDPAVTVGVSPNATSIKYRVTIKNTGQTHLSNLVVYDVLPYPGDVGTSDASASTPRGSTVKEELSSLTADSPTGMTIEYSTSTNPPRPEVYSGATSGTWGATMSGASAIKAAIATLNAGASRAFTYEAALVGAAADQMACNSLAISADTMVDSEPPRVCATTQEADFGIDVTARLPLQAGRAGVMPFLVTNGGGSQSATATVRISVPDDVDVVDLTPDGWDCTAPSTTGPVDVTCVPVNGDGTTRSLGKDVPETIKLRVKPTEDAPAELCFDAAVEGLMHDPNLENNDARSCSTAVGAKPELFLSKDDAKNAVAVGEELTYTITASNGLVGEPVNGVTVTDTLPAGLKFVSASPAPTSQSGQTLTWDLGQLGQAAIPGDGGGDQASGGPGSSKSLTVTVRVEAGTQDSVTNAADATGTDPADSLVTFNANDDDTDSVTNVFTDEGAEESTPQNVSVTTPLADIASATGAPLDPSLVSQATAPAHGHLTINPTTGAVTFVPDDGYTGDDSYEVRVCDTTSPTPQCFVATVAVHVGANVVDAVDDLAVTDAGAEATTDVRANDLTQSGQSLAKPTIQTHPSDGTVVVNANGTVTYTPAPGTSGQNSYSYQVCDTSHPTPVCDTAMVEVEVANVWNETGTPVVTPHNNSVTTELDEIVTTEGAPVDPSTVAESTAPTHGTIAIDPATGAVTYTPAPGYTGPDSYQLEVCDQGSVECRVVTVPVEVLPNVVTAVDDSESTHVVAPVTTQVRGNDTSESGQAFANPTVQSGPRKGAAVVNGDGTITYTPGAGFSGTDSYLYQVCDTSTPDPVCDTATVTVLVTNVFTALGAKETTPHNTPVTTSLAEVMSATGASLDQTSVTGAAAPAHGSISIDPVSGAVTYTPQPGYAGPDAYGVRVCDTSTPDPQCLTATVQVTVQPNAINAVDDTTSTGAGDAVVTKVRANDTSASGQPLASPTVTISPAHGKVTVNGDGTITYTPGARFSGTDVYTYRVCDTSHPAPVCDTATVTVTVQEAQFDLKLTNRLVSPSKVMAGDKVRYRLQVTNRGPDAVTAPIVLKDVMPGGLEVVSAKSDGWQCQVNRRTDKVTCFRATSSSRRAAEALPAGDVASPVFVTARTAATARGKLVNTAKVKAAGDTVTANNRADARVRVLAPPPLPDTGFRINIGVLY